MSALASLATALPTQDAKINIDRALNSPTVTVRYNGANAALVELRMNGESVGTRSVSASKAAGETNFTINLSDLKDGDNEVEIRLFDRTGKLVGSEKTNISTDQTQYGPVFLSTPKVGQTVMGTADIKLGFGRELKNVYVSFFVDNNFKKMTNYPPYSYTWDTTAETNGWHEVEAWAVDESSNTYKSRKTRVFVNNPGGRTDRRGVNTEFKTSRNPKGVAIEGNEAGLRELPNSANAKATGGQLEGPAPRTAVGSVRTNKVKANVVGGMSDLKPAPTGASIATGTKSLSPNGTRVAAVTKPTPTQGAAIRNVAAASGLVRITKGQRIPNLASFAVVLNSQFVDFDVNPRVDDGVPMTPFRHLIEKSGGTVVWENMNKSVKAKAEGKDIAFQIGDLNAKINALNVTLETAPYLDRGRTIVPLSFLSDALNVTIEYDKETGHVLITSKKD
ncbi:MAG: stalk domain-containing protein [Fimbriimonas sp.]